ncbi:MAG: hypothetical protein PQJ58_08280 [Spirochaetales bacterium]|nr:hypothetical protein [Spirochaetales bacterium]
MDDQEGHKRNITSLAFSEDDRLLVSGSFDARIKVHNLEEGKIVNSFKSSFIRKVSVFKDEVTAFSYNGGMNITRSSLKTNQNKNYRYRDFNYESPFVLSENRQFALYHTMGGQFCLKLAELELNSLRYDRIELDEANGSP